MGYVSLKRYEKTRKLWKHIGKQTPGFSLSWLLWARPKALRREQLGFHWACIMERYATPLFYSSSYFLRIKCHSAAHTSWPETWIYYTHFRDCRNSIRPGQSVRSLEGSEFIPTFLSHGHSNYHRDLIWEPTKSSHRLWSWEFTFHGSIYEYSWLVDI